MAGTPCLVEQVFEARIGRVKARQLRHACGRQRFKKMTRLTVSSVKAAGAQGCSMAGVLQAGEAAHRRKYHRYGSNRSHFIQRVKRLGSGCRTRRLPSRAWLQPLRA